MRSRPQRTYVGRTVAACTGGLAVGILWVCANTGDAAQLPVPCAGASCGVTPTHGFSTSTAPTGFVQYGQASAAQSGNTLTVTQSSAQALLNWSSFNISADGKVVFQQPGSSSVAINRIYQASPSSIFGALTANGQIYLINPNGFVFGSTATVNAAGLIASSLDLANEQGELTNGLLSQAASSNPLPAFQSDGRVYVTDASGNLVKDAQGNPELVQILVQPGAQINAAAGGRVMLAGQQVTNSGSLSAPQGQIVLAAGQTIYLEASNDPSLRGLVVEVTDQGSSASSSSASSSSFSSSSSASSSSAPPPAPTATNAASGVLSSPEGNVSLIGLAVNQSGRISATTTVSANGSVVLQAGSGAPLGTGVCTNNQKICATQGGPLLIGPTSVIDASPDLSDTTTAAVAQPQQQSSIRLVGEKIDLDGGTITAADGSLNVLAAADPNLGLKTEGNTAAQIRIASGASIDLSGNDAVLPMSANLLALQLRSNELEDDPDQRDGALHGDTVIVDVRNGRPPIISESAWLSALQAIEESIAQRTSAGGSASFQSEGDIVVASGATINVSGGSWTYQPGVIQTSQLIGANGRAYPIGTANPALSYTGVLNPKYTQTFNGFGVQITSPTPGMSQSEPGYVQGFSAGTVAFAAPTMVMQGTLLGSAVNGAYQRSAATIPYDSLATIVANGGTEPSSTSGGAIAMASGATLVIGDPNSGAGSSAGAYYFAPAVTFTDKTFPIVVSDDYPLPQQALELPISYITSGGFQKTEIFSDSAVTVPAGLPLDLGTDGALVLVAPRVTIGSSVQALAGSIDLETIQTAAFQPSPLNRPGIDIANGVTLDVSGQWTNDSTDATAAPLTATYQNGGSIVLSLEPGASGLTEQELNKGVLPPTGGELVLGDDVSLLADGGAWVKSNGSVAGGQGGSVTIDAAPYQSALQVGTNVAVEGYGVRGAAGGAFSLDAPRIAVVQGNGSWAAAQRIDDLSDPGNPFEVGSGLFSNDGFSTIDLTATGLALPNTPNGDVLTVTAGTAIPAQAQTLELNAGFLSHPSGGEVSGFASALTLPVAEQTPSVVQLAALPDSSDLQGHGTPALGNLDIQTGASIATGPGGSAECTICLATEGSLIVNGTLRTPGGFISAQIETPQDPTLDPGYLPSQRIEIGSQGVLDVSGTAVMTPNNLHLPLGTVLPGGQVDLVANRGEIITDPGSLIDIAGGSSVLDEQVGGKNSYMATTVGSAGGSLVVESSESVSLLGHLSAAGGASSSGTLAGGSLELQLNSSYALANLQANVASTFPFNETPYTVELVSSTSGIAPSAPDRNVALLGVAQLDQSGLDQLSLGAGGTPGNLALGTIELNSSAPVSLARGITLDAPNIAVAAGTSATLKAPYVVFTDSQQVQSGPATMGTGSLTVDANEIALSGYVSLQGVHSAVLNSCVGASACGDVQLDPLASELSGALTVSGDLTINAARVYPATAASYAINDGDPNGKVEIDGTNAPASAASTPPLSVGGSLTITAADITNNGTLWAPFGQIALEATNNLTLGSGSLTSVSSGGTTLPYGQTRFDQEEWVYAISSANTMAINGVPARQVSLNGAQIDFVKGATVDVSGGGDLSAYEWVPGLGGSVDALGQANASAQHLYAILPASSPYAAYDLQEFSGSNTSVGQSVYLSGVAGLPAGVYALLPARYALLPGAYLIQAEPNYQSPTGGTLGALPDSTPVVAGYFTYGNTGLRVSSGYTGFAVWPGTYGQSLAQYAISDASTFFPAQAAASAASAGTPAPVTVPADAGNLTIAVANSFVAQGNVNARAGNGGSGATIDIYTVGPGDLTITANNAPPAASGVSIDGGVLQSWKAGDLVLGGELSTSANGPSSIAVTANSVTVAAGAQLSADQILIVADQSIDIQQGATVASTSGLSGTAPQAAPTLATLDLLSPGSGSSNASPVADTNAAFLAVSDAELPVITNRAGDTNIGQGAIAIAQDATVSTRGALSLDAPGVIDVDPNSHFDASGASISLASHSIAFVPNGSTESGDAFQIESSSSLLSALQSASALRIASGSSIDILSPTLDLGATSASSTPTLQSLTLIGTAINNRNGGSVVLGAQSLTLEGLGSSYAAPTAGNGTLTLVANDLNIGVASGQESGITQDNIATPYRYLGLSGDSSTTIVATGAVIGAGTGQLSTSGNVSVAAPQLTALSESDATLSLSSGNLQIEQAGTAASPATLTASLGGGLALSANGSITDAGSIIIPGGRISLLAASDILLGSAAAPGAHANLDASGIPVDVMGVTEGAAGGIVTVSAGGNLILPSGVTVAVSGAGSAPGGQLNLSGNTDGNPADVVTLGATLLGNGATGGSFSLYANQLTGGLSPGLVHTLTAGGFTNAIDLEVANGNLDLQQGSTLTANRVTLTADSGAIDVAGTIDAPSGNLRGAIGLFANGNVTVESSGSLLADGDPANGQGGEIELSTVSSAITLAGGTISAVGAGTGQPGAAGTLLLRAPAAEQTGGASIGQIASDVNVGTIVIEPVLQVFPYSSTGDFTQNFGQIQSAVQSYVSNATSLVSNIVPAGYSPANSLGARAAILEPGVVVQASGNVLLSQPLDLSQLGAPIDLTVRATGSLDVEGSISDGYTSGGGPTALTSNVSSSLRFVAGANLSSANPLATAAGSSANLTIGTLAANGLPAQGAVIRTGTGDIDLVAANDVVFAPGSTAYTAGLSAASPRKVTTTLGASYITYAQQGGNLNVAAGGDVIGVTSADSASSWQLRTVLTNGTSSSSPRLGTYGVDLDQFDLDPWTLATFGGGDLSITAGGNVVNVSAAAADSVAISGTKGSYQQNHYASGDLSVQAGGNITTGQFLLADGTGTLNAGRSFDSNLETAQGTPVGSVFYLESGRLSLWAQSNVTVEGVMNPTVLDQPLLGGAASNFGFFTYGPDSAFSAQSTGGTVLLNTSDTSLSMLLGPTVATNAQVTQGLYDEPGSMSLRSLTADVDFGGAQEARLLYPTDGGQLEIFAARDIVDGTSGSANWITMSDAPDTSIPIPSSVGTGLTLLASFGGYNFDSARHLSDSTPASIVAGRNIENLQLSVPKAADIEAGQDIIGLAYDGQNLNPNDLTLVYAGRNFTEPLAFAPNGNAETTTGVVQVGGPGRLDLLAGGTINLGFSVGVTTVGNLHNPNLETASGASITMMAGFGQTPSYANFLTSIVEPSSTYQQQLVSYVESITGETGLSLADAESRFSEFGPDIQRPFIDGVFFSELNASGLAASANPKAGYSRGYAAIEALFPGTPQGSGATGSYASHGDIDLTYSQIYTDSGGSINLLDPGGSINVGLANAPAGSITAKPPQELGIVAVGSGDVNIYSEGDVNVNTSRIFTLGGGNILIWSEEGSIDAGNGAKTSLSVPPPTIAYDQYGNAYYAYNSAVAGSGIRTIQSNPTVPAGNVNLVAPAGFVNAGDAGIGAAGNINISAIAVLGAANINFGGTATGVPALVSNVTASVSSAASAASAATTSAESLEQSNANAAQQAPLAQAALSWLDVFVLGLGEENCNPSDVECLKRQKHE